VGCAMPISRRSESFRPNCRFIYYPKPRNKRIPLIMMFSRITRLTVLVLAVDSLGADAGFWSGGDGDAKKTDEAPATQADTGGGVHYGVDVSFPIHHPRITTNYDWLPHNKDHSIATPKEYQDMVVQPLGDKAGFYKEFMEGCRAKYGAKGNRCDQTEADRIAMSLRQPKSMQNYTDIGFKSKLMVMILNRPEPFFLGCDVPNLYLKLLLLLSEIRAPDNLWQMLKKFWDDNHHKQSLENWGRLFSGRMQLAVSLALTLSCFLYW